MPNQKKQAIVKELQEKLQGAKSLILTDYQGLKVSQIQELKKQLALVKGEFIVVKNTLFQIAAKKLGFNLPENTSYSYPTAVLISKEDEVSPLKKLVEFAKSTALPKIKFGFLGEIFLDEQGVNQLAKIPSKQVLIGKMLASLNGPTYGLVFALKGNLTKLVTALNNHKEKMQA